jgi:hypothetical protein
MQTFVTRQFELPGRCSSQRMCDLPLGFLGDLFTGALREKTVLNLLFLLPLSHQPMSSSSPRNSHEPSRLPRTLISVFSGALFGFLFSNIFAPRSQTLQAPNAQADTNQNAERCKHVPNSPIRVSVESLPPAQPPPEERETEKRKNRRLQGWTLLVNILTLAAVVWYAIVAGQQRDKMEAANSINRDTAQKQLRAYVGVEALSIREFGNHLAPTIQYNLTNFGTTPAYNVRIWGDLAVLPYPFPKSLAFPFKPPLGTEFGKRNYRLSAHSHPGGEENGSSNH